MDSFRLLFIIYGFFLSAALYFLRRLVDVAFLDLALDSALRTIVEVNIGPIKKAIGDGTAIYIAAAAAAGSNGGARAGGGTGSSRPLPGAFAAGAAMTQVG